jgi:hypothetical protein
MKKKEQKQKTMHHCHNFQNREIETKLVILTHIYMTAQSPDLYKNFNKNRWN